MYLEFFIYDAPLTWGRGKEESWEEHKPVEQNQHGATSALTACCFPTHAPLHQLVIFNKRTSAFQRLLCKTNLDYRRWFEPVLWRNVSKWKESNRELGFRNGRITFPLFQPGSSVTRVDCFVLTAWKDIMRRNHIKLTTKFTVKILSNKVPVSPL